MKRYIITLMAALIAVINVKADKVTVSDQEFVENLAKTVWVNLSNTESNYVSFQMDLTLPDGVCINKEGCGLTERIIDEDQELIIGKIGDNKYRLTSTSFSLTPISGTKSTIINLSLIARKKNAGGAATLSNIIFVTSTSKRVVMNDVSFNIKVHPIIEFADAEVKSICVSNWDNNGDGQLDTREAASIVNLNNAFKGNTTITTFDEFQYFINANTEDAFNGCSALTSIILPNVNKIGIRAFNQCSSLESVIIPEGVPSIELMAFEGCKALTTVSIASSVKTIGISAFRYCTALTTVNIANGVSNIYSNVFDNCASLKNIVIPQSVTKIEPDAFKDCSLETVVVESETPISIYSTTFAIACYDATLYVPVGSKDAYKADYNWGKFKKIVDGTEEPSIIVDGFEYLIISDDDKTAKVVGGPSEGDIEIPSSFEYNNETYSVKAIDDRAFYEYEEINSITIPNSVTSIGKSAFYGCSYLKSITFGSGLLSVSDDAFSFCHNLEKVIVPDIASWCSVSFGNEDSNPLYHGNHLYSDENTEITDLIIPLGVNTISKWAFLKCLSLKTVTIPSSVTSMGDFAFGGCNSMTSVTVNWEEPIIVNTSPFESPDNIVLYVPASCKSAYGSANYWDSFKNIREIYPSGSSVISFADSNVKSLCVANWDTDGDGELSKVEAEAVSDLGKVFSGNKSITSFDELQYFTGLMIIGKNAFSNCTALTSVTIPNSVTSIDGFAFSRCSSLTSIAISNGVTSLGDGAFYGCIGLTSITIPNGVTYIGDAAFWDCVGLTSITIPNSVSYIGGFAFEWCGRLTSIIIPNSVTSLGYGAFAGCTGLTSMTVESGNPNYDSRNDCNAIIETSTNTLILGCKSTIIPNSVTSIGDGAFYGCSVLTSITIPNSVTSIGEGAFDSCSGLTSIIIPNNVTSIGEYAFSRCSSLTSITIPNSVTTIGDGAFQNCNSLTSVTTYNSVPLSLQSNEIFGNSSNATLIVPKGSKSAYESAMYWKDFKDIREFSENGFIISANDIFRGTNLWAGYVSQEDLALPDELEAYIITDLGTTTATAYPIDYIPESEPVLLKREDTTIGSFEMLPGTGTAPTMNLLKTYSTDKIVSNREGFVLYNDEFVLVNEGTLPAGCVFLPANSTVVALTRSIIINGDDATEIENTKVDNDVPKDQWYDFQGRKLERKPAKNGIYILNGSKVVVKY